jgi:hypothetical protein
VPPRSAATRRDARAGFTLVEALAAFAIVAMLGLAIQRGVVQARLGWQRLDDRAAAERVARSLLAEPVDLARARDGGWRGTQDGRAYAVRLTAVDLPLPPPPPRDGAAPPPAAAGRPGELPIRWVPLRQRVEVATMGAPLTVETIRLCPVEEARLAFPAAGPAGGRPALSTASDGL